ncbi:MAG: dephospho-CoA kinase [Anaerolineae bacterium CG_4_9_14_3_um_filter_57_17]|nr:dephospho-CoA kinase [bacterium]NCT20746.1 dephospho-CoA kinase [bacterium]OIO84087.1 MAG: dephospho-CoA kinase [Anaerolineae bacterium CG2_30_57_67]PJB66868.1 MAG: dephospho-CoA kinase [Anaerolineae bacterium CG_4_9_14_3_um_filter_57_17]
MSDQWPEKMIIGLTGNIATGKSVVRKMLEHLGAYGIDADALSHRAIARGAPGYQPVVDAFGKWVLTPDGEIDRAKLGRLTFADPEAMSRLEDIVHPLVFQAIGMMIRRAGQKVIVIEAIKLLESGLRNTCDSIWTVDVPQQAQVRRLMEKRGMSRDEAEQRIHFQSEQSQKVSAASIVIQNAGSFEETWRQVVTAWKKITPQSDTLQMVKPAGGEFTVSRGRPRDSAAIAELISRLSAGAKTMTSDDIMAAFGEKAFLLLHMNTNVVGIAGWQVENLVARTTEFFIDPVVSIESALKALITEVERASADLQCEVSLVFLPPALAAHQTIWKQLGYEARVPQSLGVQAWADAAIESTQPNTSLFFKQLRQDRVLRPI